MPLFKKTSTSLKRKTTIDVAQNQPNDKTEVSQDNHPHARKGRLSPGVFVCGTVDLAK